jgi:hypothetical protein
VTSRAIWRIGERCGAALARRFHSEEAANNTEHRETTTMPKFARGEASPCGAGNPEPPADTS